MTTEQGTICIECGHEFTPSWDDVCDGCSGLVCPTDQVMHKVRKHNAAIRSTKKSKYCCELCEKSVKHEWELSSHFGSDTKLCDRCYQFE